MFGKLMSISDELMWRYIELLSFQPVSQVERWRAEVAGGANPRDIKVAFAKEIVQRFHCAAAGEAAHREFEARFRDGAMPADMPEIALAAPEGGLPVAQMLKQAGLTPSTTEAVRMIEQGGVRLDGERVADKGLRIPAGATLVAQVGKRKFARIKVG
jgi:tyrosyl-tRNA synthetase